MVANTLEAVVSSYKAFLPFKDTTPDMGVVLEGTRYCNRVPGVYARTTPHTRNLQELRACEMLQFSE